MIPYGRQSVSEEDIAAVVEVLRSDWLAQGPAVERFEAVVAGSCGAKHAVAVANGTAALHAAAYAAGLGPGKLLWTSPITFVASANCARYLGADVDFVDIDAGTLNMSVDELERRLVAARHAERLPDVVVPVHMCGASADVAAMRLLADEYGFTVIEDAAHALGGHFHDTRVGSCVYSEMSIFSFHPVKVVTTGEGGMVLTNDDELANRLRLFRSHGITRDPAQMRDTSPDPWYYEQIDLGYNYRMTDIQAALGTSQMGRLDDFVRRRNELAERYDEQLHALGLRTQQIPDGVYSAYHLYVVGVEPSRRAAVFAGLRSREIGVNVHYLPVHLQPYYRDLGFRPGDFPVAEEYSAGAITLPLFPAMTDEQQDEVVAALHEVLG